MKPGDMLGPYGVLSKIGEGGMGEVYRARDPRLERDIALKVLPAASLSDPTARARLLREARMAARLNHPNVCTVHEVGEADGQVYIAMELVEGTSLAKLLARGSLPAELALRYGTQIASALAHAHARAVVHRDLKSANIVITPEGHAKVLDFGLAKRLAGEVAAEATTLTGQTLTEVGVVAGTLPYMAPEQLRGHPADPRSDVWALGVVLHEMASGERPFTGSTAFELSSAILGQPPPPLPERTARLAPVVTRCLAKAPDERFQDGGQVQTALEVVRSVGAISKLDLHMPVLDRRRLLLVAGGVVVVVGLAALDVGGLRSRLLGGGAPPRIDSTAVELAAGQTRARAIKLAVLPFTNLSGDPDQEYLSDGLTQEMISQLGRLHPESLGVIARTSVMRYKTMEAPIEQIGRELGVDYVVEGTAQRDGRHIRITADLIEVQNQSLVWTDSFEREFSGILALQRDVAQNIARALALTLLPSEQARLASVRTVKPEAYEAYLKGTHHWQQLTPEELDTAEQYFQLALEKQPDYAAPYAGLAMVWAARQQMGFAAPQEAGPKATAAALKAIALDDTSAGAHAALAAVRTWIDWDWDGAEREWRRALEINPSDANAQAHFAHFLAITGRVEEALPHSQRAIELDPFSAMNHGFHGVVLYIARRFDEAIAAADAGLKLQPDHGVAWSALQLSLIAKGMRDEKLANQRKIATRDLECLAAFEEGLREGGYEGAQRRLADLFVARYEDSRRAPNDGAATFWMPLSIAMFHMEAGDYDQAIRWYEEAYTVHDPNVIYIGAEPLNDPLRADPRFQDLLRRMKLPVK